VGSGEAHVGQHVVLDLVHEGGELGHLGAELVGDLAPLGAGGLGVLLGKRGCDEGGDDAAALAAGVGRMRWTRQRCQVAWSTRVTAALLDAPAEASETLSQNPVPTLPARWSVPAVS
jgi:hypothetical protein